jgi:CcmD family protein
MRILRLSRLAAVVAAALTLSLAPPAPSAAAQDSIPAATAVAQPSAATYAVQTPPATLRAYAHVFIAFGLAWLFLFGYALSLGRRFRRLEHDLDSLRASS